MKYILVAGSLYSKGRTGGARAGRTSRQGGDGGVGRLHEVKEPWRRGMGARV